MYYSGESLELFDCLMVLVHIFSFFGFSNFHCHISKGDGMVKTPMLSSSSPRVLGRNQGWLRHHCCFPPEIVGWVNWDYFR